MNIKCVAGFVVSFIAIYFFLGDYVASLIFNKLMEKNIVGGLTFILRPERVSIGDACSGDADFPWCMLVLWRDFSFFISIVLSLLIASNFWDSRKNKPESVGNASNGE